ncbi:hypothetical protein Daus18300_009325 [Diaporthe australafricana]|uniref:2EXR domain-containing protein n=1 Tax=Diaporthe australafricana TaxID=127596 RepID=A0ABR3WEJ5_9PEZI
MATSGTNGPQCFGGLPAELRLMVWEYLLPGRRTLKAMARHGRPRFLSDECIASNDWEPRWNFQITSVVENPLLLRLCGESRAFALKKGHHVFFNIEYKEPGMWWGPEDVLLFNEEWLNKVHLNSLKDLSGLEHVQHIALDLEQSRYTAFVLGVPETLITASETGWLLADLVCLAFPKWPFAAMDNIDLARVGELRLLKFLDGQQQWTVMEAWHFNP